MKKLFVLFFYISIGTILGQSSWKKINIEKTITQARKSDPVNQPQAYQMYVLDVNNFKSSLNTKSRKTNNSITLPTSNGKIEHFYVQETSYFQKELAKKFPNIKSYSAKGIDNPKAIAKISIGTDGIHAIIHTPDTGDFYIDPNSKNKETYIAYARNSLKNNNFSCEILDQKKKIERNTPISNTYHKRNANDSTLRTYRIAIGATLNYSLFHLENQGISETATEYIKKEAVLSAINTTLTRVNSIYERDLAVKMILVANNDKIIFTNPNVDDGLDDSDPRSLLDQNQALCDTDIGKTNYDIGHVFSTSDGGLAGLSSVCEDDRKAKGTTGSKNPIGDAYNVDYVSHEIGHQFGAEHTYSAEAVNCSPNGRSSVVAVEPGSGTTIMGYAGICGKQNVLENTEAYFNSVSIQQIWTYIQRAGDCGTPSNTSNTAPVANAGGNYSVPKSTPLLLKGNASDKENENELTFCWEQADSGALTSFPSSTGKTGPLFRSFYPTSSPERYLPKLSTVVSGSKSTWEVLPSVARKMKFNFTVRDNHIGGGATATDQMEINVIDTNPFTVTSQNEENTIWYVGSTRVISWEKSSTDVAPINCKNVRIKLSTDGGKTFPVTIVESTPNDGSEMITVPNYATNNARIMIEAVDNIFYNINYNDFIISNKTDTFVVTNTSRDQSICKNNTNSISYNLKVEYLKNFNEEIKLEAVNIPNGTNVSFSPSKLNSSGNVVMTISNINKAQTGNYLIDIIGNSSTKNEKISTILSVIDDTFDNVKLLSPANTSQNIELNPVFTWNSITNATSYLIEVSSDKNFSKIIFNEIVEKDNFFLPNSLLNSSSQYYWRVKPNNTCGSGTFSTVSSFKTQAALYCTATFVEKQNENSEYIKQVEFNTINNSSGNKITNGYENFTHISTTVKPEESHTLSVTFDVGKYQDHCYAYFDWNQDYKFGKNEKYDLGSIYADDNFRTLNKTIVIPANAKEGSTRMRIIIEYYDNTFAYGEGACDSELNQESGEAEDYTIHIGNPSASIDSLSGLSKLKFYPNPTKEKVNLEFFKTSQKPVFVSIFNITGRLIKTFTFKDTNPNFNEFIKTNDLNQGVYITKIIHDNKKAIKRLIIK